MNDDVQCCIGVFLYLLFLVFGLPFLLCWIVGDLEYLPQIFYLIWEDVFNFLLEIPEWLVIIFAVYLGIYLA